MNLSKVSGRLTNIITNELDYSEEKKEIIEYAIETALLTLLGTSLIILFGYLTNSLMPVVSAAAFGSLLRRVSGGAHFNSPIKCLFFGAIVYSVIGVLTKEFVIYNVIDKRILIFIILISFLLVSFLAPVDCEAKPIHSKSLRFKLKISSMFFVMLSFFIILFIDNELFNVSAVIGVFYQSITLLPIFNKKGGVYNL